MTLCAPLALPPNRASQSLLIIGGDSFIHVQRNNARASSPMRGGRATRKPDWHSPHLPGSPQTKIVLSQLALTAQLKVWAWERPEIALVVVDLCVWRRGVGVPQGLGCKELLAFWERWERSEKQSTVYFGTIPCMSFCLGVLEISPEKKRRKIIRLHRKSEIHHKNERQGNEWLSISSIFQLTNRLQRAIQSPGTQSLILRNLHMTNGH